MYIHTPVHTHVDVRAYAHVHMFYIYMYTLRWLLIDFKREFQLNDSTRLFEVLATHYLDNDSKGLDVSINPKRWDPSGGRGVDPLINCGFELFICAAILVVYKEEICVKKEAASIYGAING